VSAAVESHPRSFTRAVETIRRRLPRPRGVGAIGVGIIVIYAVVAIVGSFVAPYPTTAMVGPSLEPPGPLHFLGTNGLGQDLWSQMLAGTRVSLIMAFVAGGGTLMLGTILGTLAGWLGGRTDALLMRAIDFIMVVPALPLLIVLGAYVGPSLLAVATVIAVISWPPNARVVRSQVLSLRNRAHLRAAVGFGAGTVHVMRRHIIPEVGLILAAGLVGAAGRAVAMEAGLAFLGLGDPVQSSWGTVMRDALNYRSLFVTPAWQWWLVPPVVALSVFLLALTFIGIALERQLNPRLARHPGAARPSRHTRSTVL
jgi:peptide/nickel transport system permease protein